MSITTANLGFPRIGAHRELKFALERYWSGKWRIEQLQAAGRQLRENHWRMQAEAGVEQIPSNDFSLYDHVLDTVALVGAVPARYGSKAETVDTDTYFGMARGSSSAPAMEMTKWFDTNCHYIVPEFETGMEFRIASYKPLEEFREAKALGFTTRSVLLGPVSFVLLGKSRRIEFDHVDIAKQMVTLYGRYSKAWHSKVLSGFRSTSPISAWIFLRRIARSIKISTSALHPKPPAPRFWLRPIFRTCATTWTSRSLCRSRACT